MDLLCRPTKCHEGNGLVLEGGGGDFALSAFRYSYPSHPGSGLGPCSSTSEELASPEQQATTGLPPSQGNTGQKRGSVAVQIVVYSSGLVVLLPPWPTKAWMNGPRCYQHRTPGMSHRRDRLPTCRTRVREVNRLQAMTPPVNAESFWGIIVLSIIYIFLLLRSALNCNGQEKDVSQKSERLSLQ